MKDIPLGKKTTQPKRRDPSALFPIPRKTYPISIYGYDLWRSYELSWLNKRGKPQAGILELVYPIESSCIAESKSLKLYLSGLSYEKFDSARDMEETIQNDLEGILVPDWILVRIIEQERFSCLQLQPHPGGICLDNLDIEINTYQRDPALLLYGQKTIHEAVFSDLLKTNCPITGQPDWASVAIIYQGRSIEHESLLKYICSYRGHEGFAEEVCEQIFFDIKERCSTEMLSVSCFYTRRGGIDINPHRSSLPIGQDDIDRARLIRQ